MALLSALLLGVVGVMAATGVTINITPSYPLGLYLGKTIKPGQHISISQMVLACPDPSNAAIQTAKYYHILPPGTCAGDTAPVIKTITAVPGDVVERQIKGVVINGSLIPRTVPIHAALFPVPVQTGYRHQLDQGEYWLMSDYHPDSFDSRYFGPVLESQILKTLKPFFTIN